MRQQISPIPLRLRNKHFFLFFLSFFFFSFLFPPLTFFRFLFPSFVGQGLGVSFPPFIYASFSFTLGWGAGERGGHPPRIDKKCRMAPLRVRCCGGYGWFGWLDDGSTSHAITHPPVTCSLLQACHSPCQICFAGPSDCSADMAMPRRCAFCTAVWLHGLRYPSRTSTTTTYVLIRQPTGPDASPT